MKNLIAVRGPKGASMVGPLDYFGNLEAPHKYFYTIKNGELPLFSRQPPHVKLSSIAKSFDDTNTTSVRVNWVSGKEKKAIKQKKKEYRLTKKDLKYSLFLHPGLLELEADAIELKYFDPRDVDLSSFKARLVDNSIPFQITQAKLDPKDYYRLISYLYEPLYADWQVKNGSGHFLEKHRFSQTITPITPDSKGFVVLGRLSNTPNVLELIAVQIPYGYTLIIEKDCIHGDTTLSGLFMMAMTSAHTTMRSADTVFLKHHATKKNVSITLNGAEASTACYIDPIVIYKNATEAEKETFRKITRENSLIFNPFSEKFWSR
jgi:hypothetical protein